MRILVITDSYPPEVRSAAQLMAELSEGLHEAGHEVTVATTYPGYNLAASTAASSVPKSELLQGVSVRRFPVLPHHRVSYLVRGINQLLLPALFERSVKREIPGPFERIIVHSPPLPLALAAGKLAKHYGAQCIANIHDIFPQNGMDLVSAWQRPLIKLFFAPMERRVYAMAQSIVVPSENHARYLREMRSVPAEKLHVIPHWIDPVPFDAAKPTGRWRRTWGLENKLVFFFGGVIGPSQGLRMVLDAAEAMRNLPDVRFLFVGDGSARVGLERFAKERGLTNVLFKPFVSGEEYPGLLKEMDVAVSTLTSDNTTPAVPAKLLGYMAAAVPVVLAVHRESDALRIVTESGCGFSAISDDGPGVLSAFRTAYDTYAAGRLASAVGSSLPELGARGRRYLEEHFTKRKLMPIWNALLRES
jgi:colanic acid biosynthesis glycosyl transferase WcaI